MQLRERFRAALEWLKCYRPKRADEAHLYRRLPQPRNVRVIGGTEAVHDGHLVHYRRWSALD